MDSREVLRRIGRSAAERVVVLHVDDVGMCHSTVQAYRDLLERSIAVTASAMVPCGWFPSVVAALRDHPWADIGVHLTLTSEWSAYRWGPVLGARSSDICDAAGYFHPDSQFVHRQPSCRVIYEELSAQVRRAHQLGLDVTHLDSHMFTAFHSSLLPVYARLATDLAVPCVGLPLGGSETFAVLQPGYRHRVVEFDGWAALPLDEAADRLEMLKRFLDGLPPGLSYVISHPAVDTPELRALAWDWRCRVADYELLRNERLMPMIETLGIELIGMREIRDGAMHAEVAASPADESLE